MRAPAPGGDQVLLVSTGTANLASVEAALRRLGRRPRRCERAEEVDSARLVVLPGVGTFGAARERLAERGLLDRLARRLRGGLPVLAVCVGFQLLTEGSEESPGVPGLGLMRGQVRRFRPGLGVPHMGWNQVDDGTGWPPGHAYFAHSYRLEESPGDGWQVAWSDHGGRFVAAARRGGVLACQFHPELSGAWGERLLAGWLGEVAPC